MEPWQDALLYFAVFAIAGLVILLVVHRWKHRWVPLRVSLLYMYVPVLGFLATFAAVPLVVSGSLRLPLQLAVFFAWYGLTRSKKYRDRMRTAAYRAASKRYR